MTSKNNLEGGVKVLKYAKSDSLNRIEGTHVLLTAWVIIIILMIGAIPVNHTLIAISLFPQIRLIAKLAFVIMQLGIYISILQLAICPFVLWFGSNRVRIVSGMSAIMSAVLLMCVFAALRGGLP